MLQTLFKYNQAPEWKTFSSKIPYIATLKDHHLTASDNSFSVNGGCSTSSLLCLLSPHFHDVIISGESLKLSLIEEVRRARNVGGRRDIPPSICRSRSLGTCGEKRVFVWVDTISPPVGTGPWRLEIHFLV